MKRATDGDDWKHPYDVISIHALVKRATITSKLFCNIFIISIHALVKRATNSVKLKIGRGGISIHALVKRATHHSS